MSKLIKIDDNYAGWIKDLSLRFRQSQIKAAVKVNSELIQFYWELGRDIVDRQATNHYGDNLIDSISEDLQALLPGVKGLSRINLYYCKRFFLLYSKVPQLVEQYEQGEKVPQIVEQLKMIPWGHHKYSLEGYNQPLGISGFEMSKVMPADFKSTLPSIEDIERELKD